jgi:demethylmenaquinone methyltransferase/2-methoxy-6-polyprenyl-1,4-benzoquinol methylase
MTSEIEVCMDASKQALMSVFDRRARRYDFTSNLMYLAGMRISAYRRTAVNYLDLRPGDTVVDAGCGTGLNFPLIQERIGPTGRIVGVDLSREMLAQAEARVARHSWSNVTLVESDLESFEFPPCDGIIAFLSITLLPEYDKTIARGYAALRPGGRWVIHDYKLPGWWPSRLLPLLEPLIKPFGGSLDMAVRRPWESIQRHGVDVRVSNRYFGFAVFAHGTAK